MIARCPGRFEVVGVGNNNQVPHHDSPVSAFGAGRSAKPSMYGRTAGPGSDKLARNLPTLGTSPWPGESTLYILLSIYYTGHPCSLEPLSYLSTVAARQCGCPRTSDSRV